MSEYGKPLYYDALKYCRRCCLPETVEGIKFDEMGICQACQSSEHKMHINWQERQEALRQILQRHKKKSGSNYDCIVPISGGKDSVFQLHVVVRVYGMKPLAVTHSHGWYSQAGRYNLENALRKLNVDHIMFTPNQDLVRRMSRRSLEVIGDSCWHCHAGIGVFPLQIAVKFNIPLIIWGESVAETSGRATHLDPIKFDKDYLMKESIKAGTDEMVCDYISKKDMCPYEFPAAEELESVGIEGIYLGNYLFWDEERQTEFIVSEYGWRETEVEGAYKRYKSVECIMAGIHDYTKFLKRGFGRGTDQASCDVRAGLLTRQEGFEIAKKTDTKKPGMLKEYLNLVGLTEEELEGIIKSQRAGKAKELP
ncbi:MAG: N-acetyl sugar amidotransferase [Candidatus Omnitrophica bacterium]|nr:N-acetyl sugar amidotransferase [Candidatus Omnitrophota bacterium]